MAQQQPRTLPAAARRAQHAGCQSTTLTGYLRNFALWCRYMASPTSCPGSTAQPGLMLQAYDAPAGTSAESVHDPGEHGRRNRRDADAIGDRQAMTAAPYHRKLARVLDRIGGLYTLNDILTAIAEEQACRASSSTIPGRSPRCRTSRERGNCSSSQWWATSPISTPCTARS